MSWSLLLFFFIATLCIAWYMLCSGLEMQADGILLLIYYALTIILTNYVVITTSRVYYLYSAYHSWIMWFVEDYFLIPGINYPSIIGISYKWWYLAGWITQTLLLENILYKEYWCSVIRCSSCIYLILGIILIYLGCDISNPTTHCLYIVNTHNWIQVFMDEISNDLIQIENLLIASLEGLRTLDY